VQCNDAEPELVATLQDEHHHVAVANAQALEIAGRHVGIALHVGKRKLAVLALVVGPKQSGFVGLFGCPGVYNIVSEVEVIGYINLQVLYKVLLGSKCGLFEESF
jgi:hypothetical protein